MGVCCKRKQSLWQRKKLICIRSLSIVLWFLQLTRNKQAERSNSPTPFFWFVDWWISNIFVVVLFPISKCDNSKPFQWKIKGNLKADQEVKEFGPHDLIPNHTHTLLITYLASFQGSLTSKEILSELILHKFFLELSMGLITLSVCNEMF